MRTKTSRGIRGRRGAFVSAALLLGVVLLPASVRADPRPIPPPAIPGVPPLPGPLAAPAQSSPQGPKLLRATPDSGPVGTRFTISGEGLPADESMEIVWATWNGSYVMNPSAETVEFHQRQFDPIGVVLARTRTDSQGHLSVRLAVPKDYGEIHDIYAVAKGVQVAKGGFHVSRKVTISPTRGPLGTTIKIKVTGIGWKPYENTLSVLYDNHYTGFISATTTRGTAVTQIRAAGPVGRHTIEVDGASATVPYLNIEQSPVAYIGRFRFAFVVTKDAGPPPATMDWPAPVVPTEGTQATPGGGQDRSMAGASARLSARSGPVGSRVEVTASGLGPSAPVALTWTTAVGNRVSPSGWSLRELPLAQARATADGSLAATFSVPDDLGGWHAVRLVQGGKAAVELPYFVERSLVGVAPTRVKAGEAFEVRLKGIGWTELDNGVAVTYDNSYIGYACGFNSQGDITMSLVATGVPGTHLIDIYPMIYQGKGKPPWAYQTPILSFKQDAPGLALGYRLPAFRLAIEVIP